jgi:hypothetical protein
VVKRYRPWVDHGDAPILEELVDGGLDIDVNYDTQVVLAADYDAMVAKGAETILAAGRQVVAARQERDRALELLREASSVLGHTDLPQCERVMEQIDAFLAADEGKS